MSKPMIIFCSARKLSSYLVRAHIYVIRGFSKHFVIPVFVFQIEFVKGLFSCRRHEEISRGSAECCKLSSKFRAKHWWGTKR